MSDEERASVRERAKLAREAKKAYAEENLRIDYPDDSHWQELARKYNVRLPNKTSPASEVKYCKRMFKKLNFDYKDWLESTGMKNLKVFSELNPDWTARAMCGLILEWVDEGGT
tara:strand:- start:13722 stop:14063 length:342 start_codon:yes stop_codon:yes gene_type:complete